MHKYSPNMYAHNTERKKQMKESELLFETGGKKADMILFLTP